MTYEEALEAANRWTSEQAVQVAHRDSVLLYYPPGEFEDTADTEPDVEPPKHVPPAPSAKVGRCDACRSATVVEAGLCVCCRARDRGLALIGY